MKFSTIYKYAVQFLWILFFYGLGLGVSFITGGIIAGSILGMVFLFGALCAGFIKPEKVELASGALLKYMVLFFLPSAVGVMVAWEIISKNLAAILVSVVVSTVLVIVVVGVVQQKLGRGAGN